MHPSISSFPNISFYDGKISDAPNVMQREHQKKYLPGFMFGPYSFVNIKEGREEFDELGHSRKNLVEVVVVEENIAQSPKMYVLSINASFTYAYDSFLNLIYLNFLLLRNLKHHTKTAFQRNMHQF
jgi:hypothetical protein